MAAHIEKQRNEYIVVDSKGKKIAGPFLLRDTAEAEIRKRERENKNSKNPHFFTSI